MLFWGNIALIVYTSSFVLNLNIYSNLFLPNVEFRMLLYKMQETVRFYIVENTNKIRKPLTVFCKYEFVTSHPSGSVIKSSLHDC